MSVVTRVVDWLDERAGVRALWDSAANEPVPGGARLTYVFGSVLVFLFMQQVILGIMLAMYYSPSATDAWGSVAYIQDQVTAGWFIRGLHHHGSSAMVVVTVVHFLQVTLYGAYRRPRELNWIMGLAMGGLVLAFALTGYLLPWDQKGYWATQVATGIMGTVPGGEIQKIFLQGGTQYGNLTLTRFYAIHVFILPLTMGLLLVGHIGLFRKHGVTTKPGVSVDELRKKVHPFIPNQLLLDVLAMVFVGAILVALTFQTHGAELFAPAQPASNFVARPEWYFLFLFQLLKYFEGPLSIIATVIIPGGIATFLVMLPWLDRAQSREPKKRMPMLTAVGAIMAGVVALTAVAMAEDAKNETFQKGLVAAHAEAQEARKWAKLGVPPAGGAAVFQNDPRYQAKKLFEEHCQTCHSINGVGGDEAPTFTDYGSRAWLSALVRNPSGPDYFAKTPHDLMDAYPEADLPKEQLDAVVEYLVSTMGEEITPPADAALAKKGKALWEDELECNSCHEIEKGKAGDAPNLHGHGTAAFVMAMMNDSSQPHLFGEDAKMPKFAGKLTQEQMQQIVTHVLDQRVPEPPADAAH